jgi:uncharacterized YccA/Bax inhibitor family protein
MRTSNPALNDSAFNRAVPVADLQPGWGAPIPPAPDEVSPWVPEAPAAAMTVGGAVSATAVLLVLLVAGAFVGWISVDDQGLGGVELPGWIFAPFIGAIALMIATILRPQWARITAPLYAVSEGVVVGAISHLYEREFDGIVLQAAGLTMGVLAVMLFLHATRIIRATEKFRMGVICATGAVCLVYVFDIVLSLFGADVPFIHDTGALGIGISLAIVVIAALNLILDFDFVERAVAAKAPKQVEWYAAFGLVVTLVWLYLELLRLLAKLQSRD